MSELIRFGVSMEAELLDHFDHLITERGYKNRSEAIRDLIRNELVQEEWKKSDAEAVGTLTIIYNHHVRELTHVLTSVQHQYTKEIITTTHIHLDHDNCLEILALKGTTEKIRKIADQLIAMKGVKHGKLVMTTTGKSV